MEPTKLQQSIEAGPHKQLLQLAGDWEGTTRTWFDTDEVVDESAIEGTIKLLFDGRFILHEYKSSFQGKSLEGLSIIGYHLQSQTFQSAWVDTFHMGTGIMFSESETQPPFYSAMGHYSSGGEQPENWGWRTVISIIDQDNITLTAYNVTPAGVESKATETTYKRRA